MDESGIGGQSHRFGAKVEPLSGGGRGAAGAGMDARAVPTGSGPGGGQERASVEERRATGRSPAAGVGVPSGQMVGSTWKMRQRKVAKEGQYGEGDEALDEFQGREVERGGAVGPGGLQVEEEGAVVLLLQACAAQGGPGDVAAEALEAMPVEEDARPACRRSRVAAC